jgi:uncharacterized membrane protein
MRKGIGVICVVLGVLMIVKGHDVADSFASHVKQVFAGVPVDAAVRFYLTGICTGLFGLLLIFWKGR